MRRFSQGGAIVVSAVILLAGCAAPQDALTPDGETTEPTQDLAAWGVDWTRIDVTPPSTAEAGYWRSLGGGDILWAYQTELPTTLYGTTDGATWLTVDLTEHGLPAEANFQSDYSCPDTKILGDDGPTALLHYVSGYGGTHPLGLLTAMWFVEVTSAGAVTVTNGADIGLERMPASEAGWDFRTRCIAGTVDLAGTEIMVGGGQWWQPYKTGSYDLFSATRGADGSWSVYSTNSPPMNSASGNHYIVGVERVGDEVMMVTLSTGTATQFDVWRTTDGRSWEVERVDAITEGELDLFTAQFAVTGDGMMAVLGSYSADGGDIVAVWSSADGSTWKRTDLTEAGYRKPLLVTESPSGLFVLLEGDGGVDAWGTSDGAVWSQLAENLPYAAGGAVPVAGGLASFAGSAILLTGLDWR
ncbi:MAG: hypothetical protein KF680_02210 [Cryobacterium sp.]|nr:hypothetical protein [Cryobacterium sp.]